MVLFLPDGAAKVVDEANVTTRVSWAKLQGLQRAVVDSQEGDDGGIEGREGGISSGLHSSQ